MGLRHRTAMSMLRDQRRMAESTPLSSAIKARQQKRVDSKSDRLPIDNPTVEVHSQKLLDRLRLNLVNGPMEQRQQKQSSDYKSLTEELERLGHNHKNVQVELPEDTKIVLPTMHDTGPTVRLIQVTFEKTEAKSLRLIPKLVSPLTHFDSYIPAQDIMPKGLTLVAAQDLQNHASAIAEDPSQKLADWMQDKMTSNHRDLNSLPIPRSLALSLLDD